MEKKKKIVGLVTRSSCLTHLFTTEEITNFDPESLLCQHLLDTKGWGKGHQLLVITPSTSYIWSSYGPDVSQSCLGAVLSFASWQCFPKRPYVQVQIDRIQLCSESHFAMLDNRSSNPRKATSTDGENRQNRIQPYQYYTSREVCHLGKQGQTLAPLGNINIL